VVFIGVPEDTEGLVCVDLDFEAAIRTSIDALVDAGHTRIALISQHRETLDRESNYPLRVVHEFERHAKARGVDFAVAYPETDDCDPVLDELDTRLPGVTGIVLSTANAVAQSLLPALHRRGLKVPFDVSVIAAGMTPIMSRTPLPFDTLPLDPRLTCPVAVDILVDLLEGIAPAQAVTLVTPIYQSQGSVAPASAAVPLQAR
jgi:DNA-binding LacI/PurR family transcriptional regulator